MTNPKIYNAVLAQLKADVIKQALEVELLMASDSPNIAAEDVGVAIRRMVQSEGAIHTLQQYFQPKPASRPPVAPAPAQAPAGPPLKITEDMSPTYKKAVAAEERRQKAEDARIKREAAAKSQATKQKKGKKNE